MPLRDFSSCRYVRCMIERKRYLRLLDLEVIQLGRRFVNGFGGLYVCVSEDLFLSRLWVLGVSFVPQTARGLVALGVSCVPQTARGLV